MAQSGVKGPTKSDVSEQKNETQITENDDPLSVKLSRRGIAKKFKAHSQKEGAGFTVHRPIGGPYLDSEESDPFLMLDELGMHQIYIMTA